MTQTQMATPIKDEITDLAPVLTEEEELYKENIIDHYQHPHNRKKLLNCTHSCRELNPVCGDQVTLYLEVEMGTIRNAAFEGMGCAISQAAASMLTDLVKDKSITEAKQYGPWTIFDLLGIKISPTRSKCALLSLVALHNALKNKEA